MIEPINLDDVFNKEVIPNVHQWKADLKSGRAKSAILRDMCKNN